MNEVPMRSALNKSTTPSTEASQTKLGEVAVAPSLDENMMPMNNPIPREQALNLNPNFHLIPNRSLSSFYIQFPILLYYFLIKSNSVKC